MNQDDLEHKLTKVKVQALVNPKVTFLAAIGMGIQNKLDESVPTACTNGREIKWGTEFLAKLTVKQAMFVYLHECYHIAMDHINQVMDLGLEYDVRTANYAQDFRINYDLIKLLGDPKIEGICYDPKYTKDWSWIDIYKHLKAEGKENEAPSEPHYTFENPPDTREIADVVYKAAEYAKGMGAAGTIPQEIKDMLDEMYRPRLDPRRMLRKYFNQKVKSHTSFAAFDRRFTPVFIPTRESKNATKIALILDVSGSITETDLINFYNETVLLVKSKNITEVSFVQFNHGIQQVNKLSTYERLEDVSVYSGGGTNIRPVFEWIEENKPNVSIVFTDGEFTMYSEEPKDVIWCVTNNPTFTAKGKVIHYAQTNNSN